MSPEPSAFAVAFVATALDGAAHVSTQLDPARGLPQLVVTAARASWPTLDDGRPDPALRSLDISVTAFGKGGERPDFSSAWEALAPVVAAVEGLASSPWTAEDDTRAVNGSDLVTSRAVDPDTGAATYTVSFTLTVAAS